MYSPSRFLFDPSSISSRGNTFSGNDNQVFPGNFYLPFSYYELIIESIKENLLPSLELGSNFELFVLISKGSKSIRNVEEATKRLLSFSSSSDIYDDEYYNRQFSEKKRLTSEQVLLLERSFDAEKKLEPERKSQLAKKLGLQPRQVAVWFQNRRARWRTKQLEQDYNLLKTSYDSLASGYDFIFKENEKLKSEVALLHEKLQAKDEMAAPLSGLKSELLPMNGSLVSVLHLETRLMENLSSYGCGGAVVNPELANFQSNEHFGENFRTPEEYEGSDDGRNYFNSKFVTMEQQQHKEDENLGWWAWS